MKTLKNIFARIWALWGICSFIITMLIVIIPILITYFIPDPKGIEIFRRISKIWMYLFLTLIGCRLRIKGRAYFEKNEVYVVVCNHNSLIDITLTTPFIPSANKTIAKKSFAKIPLFGWIYKRGSILVDRKNIESRKESMELMKATLMSGIHMCIYPEGSRNRTDYPLKPFFSGAFKLAMVTQKKIMPCLIFNSKKTLPVNTFFYLWPQILEIHFLPPLETKNYTDVEKLKGDVYEIMQAHYTHFE